MTTEPNAEQLAIALMSEARKLLGAPDQAVLPLGRQREIGDRLAQWAIEVRALGVAFSACWPERDEWRARAEAAKAKLAKVRELAEGWEESEGIGYVSVFGGKITAVLDGE